VYLYKFYKLKNIVAKKKKKKKDSAEKKIKKEEKCQLDIYRFFTHIGPTPLIYIYNIYTFD